MSWVHNLKTAISPTHDAIERLPIAEAMIRGTIDRERYVSLLQRLLETHVVLEAELAANEKTAMLFAPGMARVQTLRNDLAALHADECDTGSDAVVAFNDTVRMWAAESPMALIGALYVFEGSRMGSMALVRPIAHALGLPIEAGKGLDYHLDGMRERPQTWGKFKGMLDGIPLPDSAKEEILEGATSTMGALYELYAEVGTPAELATAS